MITTVLTVVVFKAESKQVEGRAVMTFVMYHVLCELKIEALYKHMVVSPYFTVYCNNIMRLEIGAL